MLQIKQSMKAGDRLYTTKTDLAETYHVINNPIIYSFCFLRDQNGVWAVETPLPSVEFSSVNA